MVGAVVERGVWVEGIWGEGISGSNFIQIQGHHFCCRSKQGRSERPLRKIQYLAPLDRGQLLALFVERVPKTSGGQFPRAAGGSTLVWRRAERWSAGWMLHRRGRPAARTRLFPRRPGVGRGHRFTSLHSSFCSCGPESLARTRACWGTVRERKLHLHFGSQIEERKPNQGVVTLDDTQTFASWVESACIL